jgi:hypothetical protein
MKTRKLYIKERHNPQTGVYFSPMGRMSETCAKRHEKAKYGTNIMHSFETEKEYQSKILQLKTDGATIL